jgi:hypothetical protein
MERIYIFQMKQTFCLIPPARENGIISRKPDRGFFFVILIIICDDEKKGFLLLLELLPTHLKFGYSKGPC